MKIHRTQNADVFFMLPGLPQRQFTWSGFIWLMGVYLGVMVFAACLAPWIYWTVELWHESAPNTLNTYLLHKGFDDYFDRLRWIPLVLVLPWLIHRWGLWSLTRLGFPRGSKTKRTLCRGLAIGIGLVAVVGVAQSLAQVTQWRTDIAGTTLASIVTKSLIGGLAIGFLEELVFRGLVFRVFYTAMPAGVAMIGTSLFFAYTHFKMPDAIWLATDQQVHVDSGFFVAYWTLIGISENFQPWPFVNLTLLGLLLNLMFIKTRSLWLAVGTHAGLVWAMLCYKKLVFNVSTGSESFLGSTRGTDGAFVSLLLVLLIIYYARTYWVFCQTLRG